MNAWKIQLRFTFFSILVIGVGCGESPEHLSVHPLQVRIATTVLNPIVASVIGFEADALGGSEPLEVSWSFGDGETARGTVVNHTYTHPGEFSVSVAVRDAAGQTATDERGLSVDADLVPVAKLVASPTAGLAPLEVLFASQSSDGNGPLHLLWRFGDGQEAEGASVFHRYELAGTFTATLEVTDRDGDTSTDEVILQVGSQSKPIVEVTATPAVGVEPLEVQFFAVVQGGNEPLRIAWDLDGDGQADSIRQNPTWTYTTGSYVAHVVVTDADGDEAFGSVPIEVSLDQLPTAAVEASPSAGISPLNVSLRCDVRSGNPPFAFSWELSDGGIASSQHLEHVFGPGQHTALCRVRDIDGDEASAAASITVDPDESPRVTPRITPTSGLAPLEIALEAVIEGGNPPFSLTWDLGDGTRSDAPSLTHTYLAPGSYSLELTVVDTDLDRVSGFGEVVVGDPAPPVAAVEATPTNGPAPLLVALGCSAVRGNPPYRYAWDLGDGTSSSQAELVHTYTAIGSYRPTCTVTDAFGLKATASAPLQALDPNHGPTIQSLASANGHPGHDQRCAVAMQTLVQLEVRAADPDGDPIQPEWSFDSIPPGSSAAFRNPSVLNPAFVPDVAGIYTVRVRITDPASAVATDTIAILAEQASRLTPVEPDPVSAVAGEAYSEPLQVQVETACGLPVRDLAIGWLAMNGRILQAGGPTDEDGLTSARVEIGCDVSSPARFLAVLPRASTEFNIGVTEGPPIALTVQPEEGIPVHDSAGAPNALQVMVQVTDRCGNPVREPDVFFNLSTGPHACFADLCPDSFPSGSGVRTLTAQATHEGAAAFSLYDTRAEWAEVWAEQVTGDLPFVGGRSLVSNFNFEGWDGDFVADGDFRHGILPAVPGAHSGREAWSLGLGVGESRTPASLGAVHSLAADFDLPCESSMPLTLSFWEWHAIPAGALATVVIGDPDGPLPPPADGASGYDAILGGRGGYQGTAGWRRLRFDLSAFRCQRIRILWTVFGAPDTEPKWAIDDVALENFAARALTWFAPGPLWSGTLIRNHDGVAGCPSSPASVFLDGEDRYGNQLSFNEAVLSADRPELRFLRADPGFVMEQDRQSARIALGPDGWTDLWLAAPSEQIFSLLLETPSRSGPSTAIRFLPPQAVETNCSDQLDDDCNGHTDCDDAACAQAPACLPDLAANWHSARFESGAVQYEVMWCNLSPAEAAAGATLAAYRSDTPPPKTGPDPSAELLRRALPALASWTCRTETFTLNGLGPGRHALWFVLDPDQAVVEVLETNNAIPNATQVTVPL